MLESWRAARKIREELMIVPDRWIRQFWYVCKYGVYVALTVRTL